MQYLGDFPEDTTVYIPFNTFDSNDPQASVTITNLADADIKVHKDGSTTQIVTDGATIAIDFDGITGNHLATIDTSAHADYAIGSDYMVRIEGTTVDGATINAWIGFFSIENRFNEVAVVTWNGVALGTTNPLPNAAPDAAGGLAISDAGGLDLDSLLGTLTSLVADSHDDNIRDQFKRVISIVESQRGAHTHQARGDVFYVDPINGDTHANGNRGGVTDPYAGVQDCHDNAVTDSTHDCIILLAGAAAGVTTLTENVTLSKRYLLIRGPGRDFVWTRTGDGNTIAVTADGIEISGCEVKTALGAISGNAISVVSADFFAARKLWITEAADDGIDISVGTHYVIEDNVIHDSARGIHINSGAGSAEHGVIRRNQVYNVSTHGIHLVGADASRGTVINNIVTDVGGSGDGVFLGIGCDNAIIANNVFGNISGEDIDDDGTNNTLINNEQQSKHSITTETRLAELDAANIPANIDELTTQGDTNETAIGALNDISVADLLTTQMSETYAADGTAPTLTQALFLIQQSIGDFSISGTTLTVKKLDGAATAATYTLDDSVDPTSRTRAT